MSRFGLVCVLAATVSCNRSSPPPAPGFEQLTDDFTFGTLAISPVTATQTGYHEHDGAQLDETLDDYSAAGIDAQRRFYESIQKRLGQINPDSLDNEQKTDVQIMNYNLGLAMLEFDTIQSYKHNPTVYVELIGNALYTPFVLEYAPLERRFQHITLRLEKVPTLIAQAEANLLDAPEVWNRVAREENNGNIDLIDKTLRQAAPDSQKEVYGSAADKAIAALKDFNGYLEGTLSSRTSDWRLGRDRYALKFRYALGTDKTPEQLLAEAEADLQTTRAEMARLAAPKTVKQALDEIASHHATPDTYVAAAKKELEQATAFVRAKALLTLPGRSNLQVIDTPEFMRGVYGVGGFNAAPALQPELGAFYWITPIPKTWPRDRVESKLREYNNYGLSELTIHEAMPGHYVQFEYANAVQPRSRRLIRNVFGNTPYIEGWGVYAQQMMSEEGYLDRSGGLQLTMLKQMLRVLANTIIDVRLQTMGMSDQQALDLMINDAYQETEEAAAKLQRAQLSSCQLPTYFAGVKGWLQTRGHYRQAKGSAFSLHDFHERALKEGSVPMRELDKLLQ